MNDPRCRLRSTQDRPLPPGPLLDRPVRPIRRPRYRTEDEGRRWSLRLQAVFVVGVVVLVLLGHWVSY